MAKTMNVGVGGVSRVAKSGYMGVNGVARGFTPEAGATGVPTTVTVHLSSYVGAFSKPLLAGPTSSYEYYYSISEGDIPIGSIFLAYDKDYDGNTYAIMGLRRDANFIYFTHLSVTLGNWNGLHKTLRGLTYSIDELIRA